MPVEALGRQQPWGKSSGEPEDTLSSHPREDVWRREMPGPRVSALQWHHAAHVGFASPRGAAGISIWDGAQPQSWGPPLQPAQPILSSQCCDALELCFYLGSAFPPHTQHS